MRGRIVFPESADERVVRVIARLCREGLASKIFVFEPVGDLIAAAARLGESIDETHTEIVSVPESMPSLASDTAHHLSVRAAEKGKAMAAEDLRTQSESRLYQAGELLSRDLADAALAGSIAVTADVIRAGIATCGLAKGCRTVSGSFLMLPESDPAARPLVFSDCGVVPTPKPEQLVDIAYGAARTYETVSRITGEPPRVAFLSFSTHGSANHDAAAKMATAARTFSAKYPAIACDGELQFDAAFDPAIAAAKAPGSPVAGRANCFIFPDLAAGNIAYKITQRLAHYTACGPILQGLGRAYSDLSRGSTPQDIYLSAIISLIRGRS